MQWEIQDEVEIKKDWSIDDTRLAISLSLMVMKSEVEHNLGKPILMINVPSVIPENNRVHGCLSVIKENMVDEYKIYIRYDTKKRKIDVVSKSINGKESNNRVMEDIENIFFKKNDKEENPEVHKVFVYGNAAINIINTIRGNLFDEVNDYQDREDKYEVRELEIIREDGENKKIAKVKLHPLFYWTEDNPYVHKYYNNHSNEVIANMIFLDIVQTLFTSDEVLVDIGLTLNKVILFQEYLNEKENRIIIIRKSENRDESNYAIIQKMDVLKTSSYFGIYRCNMYDTYKGSHCSFESPDFFKIIKEIYKFCN